MTAAYDSQAGASYLQITGETVARTVTVRDGLLFDVDSFNRVIGVERVGGAVTSEDLTDVIRTLRYAKEAMS